MVNIIASLIATMMKYMENTSTANWMVKLKINIIVNTQAKREGGCYQLSEVEISFTWDMFDF